MMRCFYLPEAAFKAGHKVTLSDALLKHVKKVLRLQSGSELQLFNGSGEVADVLLQEHDQVEIIRVVSHPQPACRMTLIQGVPKGDKLELILQKGTELGVNHFLLVQMERSVGQVKTERKEKRLERWQKIVQEAARQCKQYHLPTLMVIDSLAEALAVVKADEKLLLWEESRVPLEEALPQVSPQSIAVLIGPEGGVSTREAAAAEQAGYKSVGLGPRILRTETAGLAIMSILQYLYGDLVLNQT